MLFSQDVQKIVVMCVLLSQPPLVLIDHGHFQYNSVSLGFCLWGIAALMRDWDVLGSIAFSLALNYKQMELYHSLPFFCYLLGKSNTKKNPYFFIIKLGLAVILTFSVCWMPFFIFDGSKGVARVLARVFPFNRGIYEDKVASFWCSLSVLIKIRKLLPNSFLVCMSVVMTMLAALPSLWDVTRNPTAYKFLLSLVSILLFYQYCLADWTTHLISSELCEKEDINSGTYEGAYCTSLPRVCESLKNECLKSYMIVLLGLALHILSIYLHLSDRL